MRKWAWLCVLVLAACGGGNNSGAGGSRPACSSPAGSNEASNAAPAAGNAQADNSPAANTAPAANTVTQPEQPRPAAEPPQATPGGALPELFVDGWYRAPGAVAVTQFPELPEGWTLKYTESANGRVIALGREGAVVLFTFLPPHNVKATDLKLAQGLAASLAETAQKELPYLKLARTADSLPHSGGFCAARFLEGKTDKAVAETCIVAAVAEGKEAGLCLCRARKELLDAAWRDVAAKALENMRVGAHVPALPRLDPGEKLRGVFEGPTEFGATSSQNRYHWLTFDERGWCHERSPGDERELDAMYQWQPEECLRYRVANGRLELLDRAGKPRRSYAFQRQGRNLELDGKPWYCVTSEETPSLAGHYEAFTFYSSEGYGQSFTFSSSSDYWFTADGRFSFDNAAMSSLADTPGWPQADGFRSWAHAYAEQPKNHGRYRVVNNVLQLLFADGRRAARPLFLHKGSDPELIYISGSVYLKD